MTSRSQPRAQVTLPSNDWSEFHAPNTDSCRPARTELFHANALSVLNASAGQPFALGMRNVTESGQDFFLFSSMSVRGSQKLVVDVTPITAVTEPETWLMMVRGLARLAGRRVRRHT